MDQLFLIIFTLFGVIYLILGAIASKNISTTTDYFLAGRELGWAPVTFTLIATQLGGGMMLGTAQKAYEFGFYGITYTLGLGLGFLLLSLGIAERLQSLKVATTAELFQTRYGSETLKKVASLLSILTLGGLLLAQVVASKTILTGLGFSHEIAFIIFWAFIIAYTMLGGLKAVVITDIFQVLFIIVIFGGIFIYTIMGNPEYFSWKSIALQQKSFDSYSIDYTQISTTFFMPAFFALIEQDLAQRFFSSRSKWIASSAAISSTIFMLVFALVPIYFGMQTKLLGLPFAPGANPLIPSLQFFTSKLVFILAICGLVAAFTSTADSLLCAMSSNIAQDFSLKFRNYSALTTAKIITLLGGIIILGASYLVNADIINILVRSYELSVSTLFVPLLYSYFYKDLNKNAAAGGMIAGFAAFMVSLIWPFPLSGVASVGISWIGYQIGKKV